MATRPGVGRALILFLASGAAIIGLVLLATAYVRIGSATLLASNAGDVPCLQAYADDAPGSHVRYTVAPPQAICTWDVDGASQEVVVASASTAVFAAGAVLALGGGAVCAGMFLVPRWRRSRAAAPTP